MDKSIVSKAIFNVMEQKGWKSLSLHDVAHSLSISLEDLHHFATSKEHLMELIISYIEEETLCHCDPKEELPHTSIQDRQFDVLFARFEAAVPHKKALQKLWVEFQSTPPLFINFIPLFLNALKRLSTQAGIPFDGPLGIVQLRAFGLIYLRLLSTWLQDDTPDMATTMADVHNAVSKYIPCLFAPCKILDLV